eukprot:jgi/Mesvir1/16602/Mv10137-RA.1
MGADDDVGLFGRDITVRANLSAMAARASLEHERYASSYQKGAVNLPDSADVEVDLDRCFERPLGAIRPYIRTKRMDDKSLVFRTKDIGIYITESLGFKAIDDKSLEGITKSGGMVYNMTAKDGGAHITLQLIKPFILEIPCTPDGVQKRVAVCNNLLKLVGADTFVHESEIKVSNKTKSGPGKCTNLLRREAGRWEVQLYFIVAWCEDVLANYSRVLKRFDDADGEAKRLFYDLAKKMDRAEVLYPEAKCILAKLAQIPLPLRSTPAWVHDVERVKASEIPKMDSDTEVRLLRADLAIREEKCARLEREMAELLAGFDRVQIKHTPAPSPAPATQLPPSPVAVYTHAITVDNTDPFQTAVRFLVDGMRHQLPHGVHMLLHSIRDTWDGETVAGYHDRVRHTLYSLVMWPPVARAIQMLYSGSWSGS